MDTAKLTSEQRNAFTALVRSPGWSLLMDKLFLPQMQLATHFLDRPQAEQSGKADYLRGIKASYANLIDVVYYVAGKESPLVRHAAGLLASVRSSTEYDMHKDVQSNQWPNDVITRNRIETEKKEEQVQIKRELDKERVYRGRSNFPV